MDTLDDILQTLNLRGSMYFRTDFSPSWAVTVPRLEHAARFHLVVQGRCSVLVGSTDIELGPGDLILIPAGATHVLSDKPGRLAPPLETVLESNNYKGDSVLVVGDGDSTCSTQMICGHYTFRPGADHPLLQVLPSHIITSAGSRAQHPLLDESLRLMTRRMFSEPMGSMAAITRLSEIVFIELLRAGISQDPSLSSILKALRDPKISRALQLIHVDPSSPWTVQSLAKEVAMSRSRFADRFRDLIGMGPMAYLSEWRLQKALALLDDTHFSVQQVAQQTGYQSPSSFSRAFHNKFGVAPREFRSLAS